MSALETYYTEKVQPQLQDKQTETLIFTELTKMVSQAYTANMNSDESYCFKFNIPLSGVNNFYKILKLNPLEMGLNYKADWGNTLTAMHKDPYYQILLLIIYHAIKNKKEQLANNALMILLLKIWNGRKSHFFKFCDKRVMKYVISNMLTNRHGMSKFETPFALLKEHFTPTILAKYGPEIDNDISKLKRLFEQCYARVFQVFAFNPRTNIQTGKPEAQGGLLPLYMKAREEGKYITKPTISSGEDGEAAGFEEYATTHNRDEIIHKTVDFIVMNKQVSYPVSLISDINKKTNVSNKIIEKILAALHNHDYYDLLQNMIILILSRCKISSVGDICKGGFSNNIQKNIISSKNNDEINKLQKLIDTILTKIFTDALNLRFDNYSVVHKIKIRNVIIYALEYNLFRVNCRGQ